MAPPAPTILALKQNFITTQTRLLSQPLQPSRAWRRANEAAAADEEAAAVTEKAVDDALFRLNHTLQQHSRRVYVPQATRQIAEQVDRLYLSAGERQAADDGDDNADDDDDDDGDDDDDDAWRNVGADYTDAKVISSLPPAWESEREAAAYSHEAERFAELTGRLRGLAARRDEARTRVERLRRMRALLTPFNGGSTTAGEDDSAAGQSGGVQENLVTRGGELEKELERMRVLLARVGDKVARLKEREAARDDEDDDDLFGDGEAMIVDDDLEVEERKVDVLLDGFG